MSIWLIELVTILILIDGFLQYEQRVCDPQGGRCHNPYFNRWFSAIKKKLTHLRQQIVSQSLF